MIKYIITSLNMYWTTIYFEISCFASRMCTHAEMYTEKYWKKFQLYSDFKCSIIALHYENYVYFIKKFYFISDTFSKCIQRVVMRINRMQ